MNLESPVVMIGIDAATWDVIDPLLAEGRLPNLARLIREGASGKLRSHISYTSPALWTTISTGQMPERHGVLDFYSATRLHLRSAAIYDILAGDSGRIGLFRWFATWPPIPNSGFTVPSPIARTPETYPRELQFINDLTNPKGFSSYLKGGFMFIRNGARFSTLLRSVKELLFPLKGSEDVRESWYRRRLVEAAIHGDVFAFLLRKFRPLFSAILFTLTDDLSHRYWKYRQPDLFHDVTPDQASRYGGVIDEAYIAVDKALGIILRSVPDHALVVVLSDHGQQAGEAEVLPSLISQKLIHMLGFENKVWMTNIGFKAYFRSRNAISGDTTLKELKRALEGIHTEPEQRAIISAEFDAPDRLVAEANLKLEDNPEGLVHLPGGTSCVLNKVLYSYGEISGHHSEWGILLLRGPGVRQGYRFEMADILDVTPTILALRGLPVGLNMEGEVITGLFEEDFLDRRPVKYIEAYHAGEPTLSGNELTAEELESLEEQLRRLGYLT